MKDNLYTNLIGIGVSYPIQLTENDRGEIGWYPLNGDFQLIRDNISSILYYQIGQRFRQENFGNRLWQCIEEPNTQALKFLIKEFILQAIGTWEQRITLKNINITREGSKVLVGIHYIINQTNTSQYLDLVYDHSDNTLKS